MFHSAFLTSSQLFADHVETGTRLLRVVRHMDRGTEGSGSNSHKLPHSKAPDRTMAELKQHVQARDGVFPRASWRITKVRKQERHHSR